MSATKILAVSPICIPVQVYHAKNVAILSAIIGSGAAGTFTNQCIGQEVQLLLSHLENPP